MKIVVIGCGLPEAEKAYDAAARKYQGEFAYQNFGDEQKQGGLKGVLRALRKRVLRTAWSDPEKRLR